MIRAGHGEQLPASVGRCIECGTGRRSWGRLCGDCYRAEHGIVIAPPVVAPVVVVVAPCPTPAPAAPRPPCKAPTPRPPPRLCSWPGCDRRHAMRGYCYRDSRRLPRLGVDGSDPAALPALWAAHLDALADVFVANGAARKGAKWRRPLS